MTDVKLRECPLLPKKGHYLMANYQPEVVTLCLNCPNRKPSEVEQELRRMVDALAKQANEEELLKIYNAELVEGRDKKIRELRDCLKRAVETRIDEQWLKDARALLKKGAI